MPTLLWVRGRHMQAKNLEQLVIGDPGTERMGSLTMAAMLVLTNPDVTALGFGTGASSTEGGTIESVWMRARLQDAVESGEFRRFSYVGRLLKDATRRERLESLLLSATIDTRSQNTAGESDAILDAATKAGAGMILDVTCGSHAARCANSVAELRRRNHMSPVVWSVVPDDMDFGGLTTVFEEPHRGDDPIDGWPKRYRPNRLFSRFFRVSAANRPRVVEEVDEMFTRYGV